MNPNPVNLVNVARSVAASNLILESAAMGWRYATHLEADFIVSPEDKKSLVVPDRIERQSAAEEDQTISAKSAAGLLQFVLAHQQPSAVWDAVTCLVNERTSAAISDDFYHLSEEQVGGAAVGLFHNSGINILILGGGIVGLALANALKIRFGPHANILIIETRVSKPHHKKLFSRNWLTYVTVDYWPGLFDSRILEIAKRVATPGLVGLPINALETLFLLSNRSIGVKFLYLEQYALDFLANSNVNMVFDATGGRLGYNFQDASGTASSNIALDNYLSQSFGQGFAKFGITNSSICEKVVVSTHPTQFGHRIGFDGEPITVPMIKITNVPKSLYTPIFDAVVKDNSDSKFYIWPGALKDEINQLLFLINLNADEWNHLAQKIQGPIALSELILQHDSLLKQLDPRFAQLLHLIHEDSNGDADPVVEPPFLYEPRIRLPEATTGSIGQIPLIPIGDSLFNGHPKVGNGVGRHLAAINAIIQNL